LRFFQTALSYEIKRKQARQNVWIKIKGNEGDLDGVAYTLNQFLLIAREVGFNEKNNRQILYKIIEKYAHDISNQKSVAIESDLLI